jgi:Mn-containing catalase
LSADDADVLDAMRMRTQSDPDANPITGADLGSGKA